MNWTNQRKIPTADKAARHRYPGFGVFFVPFRPCVYVLEPPAES